jgi:PPOX class probable F420-dependent enzyme
VAAASRHRPSRALALAVFPVVTWLSKRGHRHAIGDHALVAGDIPPALADRLGTDRNVWLTTVRVDGSPHTTPIWFRWAEGAFWVCTTDTSIKARNVAHRPRVSVALEDGNRPVVAEGVARRCSPPYPPAVVAAYVEKFDWDITSDAEYDVLLEVPVARWLLGGPRRPASH